MAKTPKEMEADFFDLIKEIPAERAKDYGDAICSHLQTSYGYTHDEAKVAFIYGVALIDTRMMVSRLLK